MFWEVEGEGNTEWIGSDGVGVESFVIYILSDLENDCDVTYRAFKDAHTKMRQSQDSFVNVLENTEVTHVLSSVFL